MYTLTLIDTDGRKMAAIPESPVLPRYLHLRAALGTDEDGVVEFSDEPESDHSGHVDSFARVVCVHVDDDKVALFVRMTP